MAVALLEEGDGGQKLAVSLALPFPAHLESQLAIANSSSGR